MQDDYTTSKIKRNRALRAELYDLGLYPIIHTPLNEIPADLIPYWVQMKATQVNRWKRVKRLRAKVVEIVTDHEALFLSLTFTDDVMAKTSPETRRKYISRFLGAFKVPYIANLDYGEDFGREHYHALIQIAFIDNSQGKAWPYGNLDFVKIWNKDDLRLSRYVTKLTYHAMKQPARIIYPKKTPAFDTLAGLDLPF